MDNNPKAWEAEVKLLKGLEQNYTLTYTAYSSQRHVPPLLWCVYDKRRI